MDKSAAAIYFACRSFYGHSSLEMVKEYVAMFTEDLKDNYNQFNALERHVEHKQYISMSINRKKPVAY